MAVPQIQENVAEVLNVIPQEQVSERIVVPQIQDHSVEVFKMIRQERESERVVEQIVTMSLTQERALGVFKVGTIVHVSGPIRIRKGGG